MRILRFTIFIAAAVFTFNALFTFNGTAADTAESSEADASMRCCRERLSDDEKLLYDALVTCALSESPDEETDHITVSLDPAGDEVLVEVSAVVEKEINSADALTGITLKVNETDVDIKENGAYEIVERP